MKKSTMMFCVAASALSMSLALAGCSKEVEHSKTTSVSSDGTSESKEKTVTKAADGTVTKEEVTKSTTSTTKP